MRLERLTFAQEVRGSSGEQHALPFWMQGDERMCVDPAIVEKRSQLRSHPAIVDELQLWWETALHSRRETLLSDDDGAQAICRSDYVALCLKLSKATLERWDRLEAKELATHEWDADCRGRLVMTRTPFMDAIFEMADLWTLTVEVDEHVALLRTLFKRVAKARPLNAFGEGPEQARFWGQAVTKDGRAYVFRAEREVICPAEGGDLRNAIESRANTEVDPARPILRTPSMARAKLAYARAKAGAGAREGGAPAVNAGTPAMGEDSNDGAAPTALGGAPEGGGSVRAAPADPLYSALESKYGGLAGDSLRTGLARGAWGNDGWSPAISAVPGTMAHATATATAAGWMGADPMRAQVPLHPPSHRSAPDAADAGPSDASDASNAAGAVRSACTGPAGAMGLDGTEESAESAAGDGTVRADGCARVEIGGAVDRPNACSSCRAADPARSAARHSMPSRAERPHSAPIRSAPRSTGADSPGWDTGDGAEGGGVEGGGGGGMGGSGGVEGGGGGLEGGSGAAADVAVPAARTPSCTMSATDLSLHPSTCDLCVQAAAVDPHWVRLAPPAHPSAAGVAAIGARGRERPASANARVSCTERGAAATMALCAARAVVPAGHFPRTTTVSDSQPQLMVSSASAAQLTMTPGRLSRPSGAVAALSRSASATSAGGYNRRQSAAARVDALAAAVAAAAAAASGGRGGSGSAARHFQRTLQPTHQAQVGMVRLTLDSPPDRRTPEQLTHPVARRCTPTSHRPAPSLRNAGVCRNIATASAAAAAAAAAPRTADAISPSALTKGVGAPSTTSGTPLPAAVMSAQQSQIAAPPRHRRPPPTAAGSVQSALQFQECLARRRETTQRFQSRTRAATFQHVAPR